MLIAFHGKAGSGKSTAATILNRVFGHVDTSFAEPLKRATMIKFGLSEWHVFTDEGKRTYLPEYGATVREILQKEGTDYVKPFWGEDFWVRRWSQALQSLAERKVPNVTVSDLRFPDEAEAVVFYGGYVIHIIRPEDAGELVGAEAAHRSEQTLSDGLIDFVILNNGTIEELEAKLRRVVHDILEDEKELA